MRPSVDLYGKYYDTDFVREHSRIFTRQAIWAASMAEDLMRVPLLLPYFDFDIMAHRLYPARDMAKVNRCLEAVKWNNKKFIESFK